MIEGANGSQQHGDEILHGSQPRALYEHAQFLMFDGATALQLVPRMHVGWCVLNRLA
jgi:hypothetical protein